ncbi:hypothetical protein Q4534_18715 [Cyclobacterium sp. 1_MG-2023]|uniref:hypothetical protein n=1 Tax=Cyclobacterium sp. 1_MG-2023 TaxID=3062681 RepID=UPI0026E2906D|nr:hypothetical protein [Cyclobacterium sp. 1_MG-2023]MDO6439464.1 hypothetical protein [Cyclobacterium sp. 1_MG-2023]
MVKNYDDIDSVSALIKITKEKELFENISRAKKEFIHALSLVGNNIAYDKIEEIHDDHKGIKISQGNELQSCPYQVLDIVRDFDLKTGLNIRILHWWGRGAYFLVFYGTNHPLLAKQNNLFRWLKAKSFDLCTTGLWDYKGIIDQKKIIPSSSLTLELITNHLDGEFPFQIIKPITFENISSLRQKLVAEFIDLHAFHLEK